jgi:AcrR family transcriptional regulator
MQDKTDRRSQRTRQAIDDAFIELLMEKGYDALSIKDIIERANVGRSTFYAHYKDKEGLFVSQMERLVKVLSQHAPQEVSEENPYFPSLGLFRHVQEQKKLYKLLSWDSGINLLNTYLQRSLSDQIEQSLVHSKRTFDAPIPVIANFLSGSFLSMLRWWLDGKMAYSPEEINTMYCKLAVKGLG